MRPLHYEPYTSHYVQYAYFSATIQSLSIQNQSFWRIKNEMDKCLLAHLNNEWWTKDEKKLTSFEVWWILISSPSRFDSFFMNSSIYSKIEIESYPCYKLSPAEFQECSLRQAFKLVKRKGKIIKIRSFPSF